MGVVGASPPSESKGWGGGLSLGEGLVSISICFSVCLFVSVTCTDMYWYVLIYMLIDLGDLLRDNNKYSYLVDWEVVGALPTPFLFDHIYIYRRRNLVCTTLILLCNKFYYL